MPWGHPMKPIEQIAKAAPDSEIGKAVKLRLANKDITTREITPFLYGFEDGWGAALCARDAEWREAVDSIKPPDHYRPNCTCYGCKTYRQVRESLKGEA